MKEKKKIDWSTKDLKTSDKVVFILFAVYVILFAFTAPARAYTVENKSVQYSNQRTTNNYVIAHETANSNATVDNEVAYMKNNWQSAYVHYYVGGGGRVIMTAPPGFVAWGAGGQANWQAPVQIELARDQMSKAKFAKNYPVYVNLLRSSAKQFNIPYTLDSSGRGIKSHRWISYNLGGTDHSDPYDFLSQMGVSKAQFERDLLTGLPENGYSIGQSGGNVVTVPKPLPSPSSPSTSTLFRTYTFSNATNIRTAPNLNSSVVGTYQAGQSVNYDSTVTANGYTWMRYISYSGHVRYVAQTNSISSLSDSYRFNYTTNVRTSPNLNAPVVAQYAPGQILNYNRTIYTQGYTWMEYTGSSGYLRYAAQTN